MRRTKVDSSPRRKLGYNAVWGSATESKGSDKKIGGEKCSDCRAKRIYRKYPIEIGLEGTAH